MPARINRRQFQCSMATALWTTAAIGQPSWAQPKKRPPSDRIAVGIVGLGSRGFNLLDELTTLDDVDIVMLCDVDRFHYRDLPWGKGTPMGLEPAVERVQKSGAKSGRKLRGIRTTKDFREVCGASDVDAVIVATPDHWHALCTVTALRNGKDVYCEKPVTHWFHEGLEVCREVERRGAVFQTGSQQRSGDEFRRAAQFARSGLLGKIARVEVGLASGYEAPMGDETLAPIPEGIDYEMWCGPAPVLPYCRARHHRWWRGTRAYGGGVLMDWIGHHNDIAHWGLGEDKGGPERIEAKGWVFPKTELYDTPWHYEIECQYKNGVVTSIADSYPHGTKFIGDAGWVHVTRGKLTASDPRWLKPDFSPGGPELERSPGHMRNFIDCVKSRATCVAPCDTAHRSITPGHLGYVSHRLQRPLKWDAVQQRILGDDEADRILREGTYRQPWSLEGA